MNEDQTQDQELRISYANKINISAILSAILIILAAAIILYSYYIAIRTDLSKYAAPTFVCGLVLLFTSGAVGIYARFSAVSRKGSWVGGVTVILALLAIIILALLITGII